MSDSIGTGDQHTGAGDLMGPCDHMVSSDGMVPATPGDSVGVGGS